MTAFSIVADNEWLLNPSDLQPNEEKNHLPSENILLRNISTALSFALFL